MNRADSGTSLHSNDDVLEPRPSTALLDQHPPHVLVQLLDFRLPVEGQGKDGLLSTLDRILQYSVNTWDKGFMQKLSKSTNPIGVVSELILAVLNVNVGLQIPSFAFVGSHCHVSADWASPSQLHVYQVSPVLTIIEKTTARHLASLFGLTGPHAGGTTQPGGSASNTTALVVARNAMYPETKIHGYAGKRFVMFTSAHGHYSFEKAAQICGFGSSQAWAVPVDVHGRMDVSELRRLIRRARDEGMTPFFVNATAGTTVLGAYDSLPAIAEVCRVENLWFHVDASWGGAAIFSSKHRHKLEGSESADSLTVNPHKMMGVPLTCSFLLVAGLRKSWRANTLPAGYLFHGDDDEPCQNGDRGSDQTGEVPRDGEVWDLGDITLQCGRKGDSLKLALGWIYYGSSGYESQIDEAFDTAAYLATLLNAHPDITLWSESPPPCLQVCFYLGANRLSADEKADNSSRTKATAKRLVPRGFMVDYAPGEFGLFLRAVVHLRTTDVTVENLVKAVVEAGVESG